MGEYRRDEKKAPQSLFNKKQQPEWKRETKTHLGLVRKECDAIAKSHLNKFWKARPDIFNSTCDFTCKPFLRGLLAHIVRKTESLNKESRRNIGRILFLSIVALNTYLCDYFER